MALCSPWAAGSDMKQPNLESPEAKRGPLSTLPAPQALLGQPKAAAQPQSGALRARRKQGKRSIDHLRAWQAYPSDGGTYSGSLQGRGIPALG